MKYHKFIVAIDCEVVDYRTVYATSEKEAIRKALDRADMVSCWQGSLSWNTDTDQCRGIHDLGKVKSK